MLGYAQAVVHLTNQAQYHAARDRIETHEGLVVDQELGIHRDRTRQRDASRHAAGQLGRHHCGGTAQAHRIQLRITSARISGSVRSVCSRSGNATFSNTSRSVSKAPCLKQHPHALAHREHLRAAEGRKIRAEHRDLPVEPARPAP